MSAGDTLMLQLEIPPASVETALTAAKAKGVISIINIAPLTPDAARLGRMADIVIANETEFELLAGRDGLVGRPNAKTAMQRLSTAKPARP